RGRDRDGRGPSQVTRFAFAAALVFAAGTGVASAQSPHQRLARLADESYSRYLDLFPQEETLAIGAGPRMDRLEEHVSTGHEARQREYYERVMKAAAAIPARELDETDRVTRRLLEERSRWALERLAYPLEEHK